MSMNAIEANSLSKGYGKAQALRCQLVGKGKMFGIIGPDGRARASPYRILCSLLLPDDGHSPVDGYGMLSAA